ncbi:MAG: hypothetical protein ACRDHF_12605 [Tepidiformaceae bacterium]
MATDWAAIAAAVMGDCPSPTLRDAAITLLERVELLGPLRPPRDEFRRVYHSLRWNEADRLLQIVNALLPRVKGPDPRLVIRADAWGYVIGVLDEWIGQARIFYLVAGILEAALRARIDARLTDAFGTGWLTVPEVVPSKLHELATAEQRDAQLAAVHDLAEEAVAKQPGELDGTGLVGALQAALRPPVPVQRATGALFLRDLSFGGLRMFFEKRKLWEGKAQLQEVFRGRDGQAKVQHDKVRAVLAQINEARNDVSHYRPLRCLTFENPLFAAATLASWLGEDLQHVYGSVDTRHTTELSVALAPVAEQAGWSARGDGHACVEGGCAIPVPYDWLLARAPLDLQDLTAIPVRRACLYHRVAARVAVHRPGRVLP